MAIHPSLPSPPSQSGHLTPQQAHAISRWTEEATASLQNLDISASGLDANAPEEIGAPIRGTSVPLTIPLDDPIHPTDDTSNSRVRIVQDRPDTETHRVSSITYRRREPIRRDSLKRREALLKGKEGSRRRQRWENGSPIVTRWRNTATSASRNIKVPSWKYHTDQRPDEGRLLNNPWAQPPSASDWLIQPTYPRHDTVPYYLATLWDAHYAHKEHGKGSRTARANKSKEDEKHQVLKDLRQTLKHARAARGLLQDLEEDIRRFVKQCSEKQLILREEGLEDAPTSSDSADSEDEIVFVGRNGQMHDSPERRRRLRRMKEEMNSRHERDGEKMVFESLANDRGAVFGRWLVHSIATYYGLYTWSVTIGDPARRQAYVGFNPPSLRGREGQILFPPGSTMNCRGTTKIKPGDPLPKPLWMQL